MLYSLFLVSAVTRRKQRSVSHFRESAKFAEVEQNVYGGGETLKFANLVITFYLSADS